MTLTPEALESLLRWVRTQRWYPAKGEPGAAVRLLGTTDLPDPAGEAHVALAFVAVDRAGGTTSVLQVPVVATVEVPETGVVHRTRRGSLVDGPYHPAFLRAWLHAADVEVSGLPGAGVTAEGARVLGGEQSNTSVLLPGTGGGAGEGTAGGGAGILKVFRVLADGPNPEVEVAAALARSGWGGVPAPLGWLQGSWPAPDGGTDTGHLGVLAAFVAGAQDGFERTCERAGRGDVAGADARALGATVASMHAALAAALPTPDDRDDDARRADVVAALRQRARWAIDQVPVLGHFAAGIERVVAEVAALASLPATQRVHGDLHLGQVLHAGEDAGPQGGAWFVLDFEGEPLRPLAERTRPDHALRDLAGMLRSVDYAAAVGGAVGTHWAAGVRDELVAGYGELAGEATTDATSSTLLRALELDKALYEVVYEHHNRPDWLAIPLEGVRRLTEEESMSERDKSPQVPAAPQEVPQPPQDQYAAPAEVAAPTSVEPAPESAPSPAHQPPDVLARLGRGEHFAPHDVLGPHALDGVVTIRTVRHLASAVTVVTADARVDAVHEQDGVWVAALAGDDVPDYRLEVTYDGEPQLVDDPYRFLPTLGEIDQHLVREGRHERLWDVLGAHVRRYDSALGDVVGTSFAVWAPNARAVRVIGDFNGWDGAGSGMRALGDSGVWELFVPGVGAGQRYKYEIGYADGTWHAKADPLARATEVPPSTASVVAESSYAWGDEEWLARRAERDPHSGPMSVYEVHLGSWRQGLSYRELAEQLTEYVTWMGFTHVELLPVAEHPFGGSWGYQVTSYYAPTARFGSPDDLRYLIDTLHQAGVGVILDWVPAHFPKDAWALARFDGTPLYEHPDPMRGEQQDWGTYVFDFGRREVRNFLVANAVYWLSEFHVDGLRVDAVASMLYLDYSREPGQWRPNERGGRENLEAIQFLQETNATAYRTNPGVVMIAEESTAFPGVTAATSHGGLGFGLKWNMGWMNDTLRYVAEEPVNRRYHHGELTFSLVYAFSEQYVLPLSHDEVVHGKGSLLRKMPGDRWQQLAGLRALFAYMWTHPGKNLVFMGGEFGQDAEWAEGRSLDWWQGDTPEHNGVRLLLRDLNTLYREHPALWAEDFSPSGFSWLEAGDGDHNTISYLRHGEGETVAVVVNFAGTPHEDYRIGLPHGGDWLEVLNTDAEGYGGSGVGNLGRVTAQESPWAGRSHSATLRVPPLGAVLLVPAPTTPGD